MARLQLIIPLMVWGAWFHGAGRHAGGWTDPWTGTSIYLGGLLAIVFTLRLASGSAMRRTTAYRVGAVPRFHRMMTLARWSVLGLNAVAVYGLGYGHAVLAVVPTFGGRVEALAAFASILPTIVAWAGLLWTQYPLDRGVREQNALYAFEYGEPVHAVPTLGEYLGQAMRLQVLFTLVPLLMVALLRDGLYVLTEKIGWPGDDSAELIVTVVAAGVVFLLAPEVLRHVLPTQPLPPSPVRERLESLCGRLRLRYREILLWHTHHALANAAVMGLVPRVRYILMTDLLLETMTADQVEAVFAHELGHVVKRHMLWYVAFILLFLVGGSGLEVMLTGWVDANGWPWPDWATWAVTVIDVLAFFVLFGMLSRSFERQADAFAAAALTRPAIGAQPPSDGAAVFNSALRQVARLNNMPIDSGVLTRGRPLIGRIVGRAAHHAGSWLHGSIRSRIDHLTRLAERPAAARRFDGQMLAVRCLLLVGLGASVAWTIVQMRHPTR